jgi:hypothetical protein
MTNKEWTESQRLATITSIVSTTDLRDPAKRLDALLVIKAVATRPAVELNTIYSTAIMSAGIE